MRFQALHVRHSPQKYSLLPTTENTKRRVRQSPVSLADCARVLYRQRSKALRLSYKTYIAARSAELCGSRAKRFGATEQIWPRLSKGKREEKAPARAVGRA